MGFSGAEPSRDSGGIAGALPGRGHGLHADTGGQTISPLDPSAHARNAAGLSASCTGPDSKTIEIGCATLCRQELDRMLPGSLDT
jgi:hypothetical protein